VLLLQSMARRRKWRCATAGYWNGSLHAVVQVPAGSTDTIVKDGLGSVMETVRAVVESRVWVVPWSGWWRVFVLLRVL